MSFEGLLPETDVGVAAWIAPRLCGFGGRVCSVVPQGFEAYARVLHPPDGNAAPVDGLTWADVCRATGAVPHALMQWHSISRTTRADAEADPPAGRWTGPKPREGNLAEPALQALLGVLEPYAGGQDCFVAVWEGWGWVDGGGTAFVSATSGPRELRPPVPPRRPGVPLAALEAPRLQHPQRNYLLFKGTLHAATTVGHQVTPDWFVPQSPSLMWPADRSWCIATEVDFDSTLVGGSRELIDAVIGARDLEAWPVGPQDDLSYSGDLVNSRATRG
ncbi:hypothetical protein CLV35_2244 [Motilibacter peucedani]|uniref:Uncharacterized protein n=1 Tax=Motilibacter peucedani TaxID=598650 RepID=A0A420XNH5_9ACTN|nr:hypothetical protein [Motilibacter peucedani]RKS73753.1 hypothetical protein CLV35_2244 [Motilibacter peucedani]